ncbi:uncharacterized protein LOC114944355 [Nylanderia fulva]|uniref:uncharacterized protein LOC114944355 n=1 Tax=Nylanderia fulva TaxID=613905 RepID=UPI0010FAE53E|nr:uncharacterized protein LOC114944355 [Nylanderia fulva]
MTESIDFLLTEQSFTIDAINRSLVNVKKLSKAQTTVIKLESRLKKLHDQWSSCKAIHVRILHAVTPKEKSELPYFVKEEFYAAEETYDVTVDLINEAIKKLSPTPPTHGTSDRSSIFDSDTRRPIHLPRISLPKFSGKFTEWENFKGIFESLVTNNDCLSNTEKLHYLKTSVTGDAARLIANIRIADENYAATWQLLTDEYDNKFAIIQSHIHAFAELPIMRSETAAELRQLRDSVAASLAALDSLDRPVKSWDDLLVYLISRKFSSKTKTEWNLKCGSLSECPTYKEIHDFMTVRIRGLTDQGMSIENSASNSRNGKPRGTVNNVITLNCVECSGTHWLSKCDKFLARSIDQRINFIDQKQLCRNCFRKGHSANVCMSRGRCLRCQKRHHTTLHKLFKAESKDDASQQLPDTKSETLVQRASPVTATVQSVSPKTRSPANILLATAWVIVRTQEGRTTLVRALLDQGSTYSFISESLCQTLRTRRQRANLQIRCFGEKYSGSARSRVHISLSPSFNPRKSVSLWAYAYEKITSYASSQIREINSWPHLRGLQLADPDPSSAHQIHLLIGADLYGALLIGDIRHGPPGTPTAQSTLFGWILSGPTGPTDATHPPADVHNCVVEDDLAPVIQQFWTDETISDSKPPLTEDEQRCEQHFAATHKRDVHGRYVVRLPFKNGSPPSIGESFQITSVLHAKLTNRLSRQSEIRTLYHAFLADYEELGHMTQIKPSTSNLSDAAYIPHHAVLREHSTTTKLRVVFNASCRTSNGTSLNDHLMIGPKLQQDLAAIVLRWRLFQYVYTADIAKMYRQISVHHEDRDYQRILWQPPGCAHINHYQLNTVTYGTACAPYLAMRVLQQLNEEDGHEFPLAQTIFRDSIYVDDTLFGADEISDAIKTRDQLIALMKRGQFDLRKWTANSSELLADIPLDRRQSDLAIKSDDSLKVLGLSWSPHTDSFCFKVSSGTSGANTKRSVLSLIAKLYDPLGWASPVVITAKILLQELWLAKIDWDDPLPPDLLQHWISYYSDLPKLETIKIPRWTGSHRDNLGMELHGFADASKRAYAAMVYLRVLRSFDDVQITLLCAKTKVAPLKTLSIPRLELNAAVLLSRLIKWIYRSFNLSNVPVYGWTDSTVTLAWITQHPSRWRTYVATRVSEIQTTLPTIKWHHVKSAENPADCASRGLSATEFMNHSLWFSGPSWLRTHSSTWPIQSTSKDISINALLEESSSASVHLTDNVTTWNLPNDISTWTKLIRVTAYLFRFVTNLRNRLQGTSLNLSSLEAAELHHAEHFWLEQVQRQLFSSELSALKRKVSISKSSRLSSLRPFLGQDQLIHLGGRLKNALLPYSECHPIILADHRIVQLLIANAHTAALHGGTQLTLRILRQRYWIISARSQVRKYIRSCITCERHRAVTADQLMGQLPEHRVAPSASFTCTGVDYAGPIPLTLRAARGQKTMKHYIAIFVCFTTKAIHLECVDDYSTEGFLAALSRFTSRRGLPSHIYSDNGTNFIGADKELRNAFRVIIQDPILKSQIANDRITWHFNPPAAPHFGGVWEANVKNVKYHLKRVIGTHVLTRVEFQTLLCRIEACLNSRPLTPMSDDASDFTALTPGHFLIGRPLVSVPEQSVSTIHLNALSRWQLVQRLHEQFWHTWSHDYLHSLQQRSKWRDSKQNLAINDFVLIKNNVLPPAKWNLGRIVQVHPGADGLVRVVTVRTATSLLQRPITQLCKLPIANCDSLSRSTTQSISVK